MAFAYVRHNSPFLRQGEIIDNLFEFKLQIPEQVSIDYVRERAKFDGDWIENYKFFRGNQWTEKRPSYRHSEVLNFVHAAIQTIVPILTDRRPNIEALPENPSDFEFAEIMTQVLRGKWDRESWGQIVAEGIVDACNARIEALAA